MAALHVLFAYMHFLDPQQVFLPSFLINLPWTAHQLVAVGGREWTAGAVRCQNIISVPLTST